MQPIDRRLRELWSRRRPTLMVADAERLHDACTANDSPFSTAILEAISCIEGSDTAVDRCRKQSRQCQWWVAMDYCSFQRDEARLATS